MTSLLAHKDFPDAVTALVVPGEDNWGRVGEEVAEGYDVRTVLHYLYAVCWVKQLFINSEIFPCCLRVCVSVRAKKH